jgi:hypothetical protein
MNWIYSTGTEKTEVPIVEHIEPDAGMSSLFGPDGSSTLQPTTSPSAHQLVINEAEYLEVGQSSAVLTIFTAEADVELSQKISAELRRSTQKNPPREVEYKLIYVRHPLYTNYQGC